MKFSEERLEHERTARLKMVVEWHASHWRSKYHKARKAATAALERDSDSRRQLTAAEQETRRISFR